MSEVESREHTRSYDMTGFLLPKPEHHPQREDSENGSDTAEDHRADAAGAPLGALLETE